MLPERPGYNIRIDFQVVQCFNFYGVPYCYEETIVIYDVDVALPDLGLDSYISKPSNTSPTGISVTTIGYGISSDVHQATAATLSTYNISSLIDVPTDHAPAMQKLGASLPSTAGDARTLRCVVFCGSERVTYFSDPYGWGGSYTEISWADTWTPITIPGGGFDSANYSEDAYNYSLEMASVLPQVGSTAGTVARPVLDKMLGGVILVGAAIGGAPIVEDIIGEITTDDEILSPEQKAVIEDIVNTACIDVTDPEECRQKVEEALGDNATDQDDLPPIVGPTLPNGVDEDWMAEQFRCVRSYGIETERSITMELHV